MRKFSKARQTAQALSKLLPPETTTYLPLIFFAALLFGHLGSPPTLVFDEVHYVPAAKTLVRLLDNLNWVHPPLGKLILGGMWLVFTKALGLLGEPTVFRLTTSLFGLWALWSVKAWMLALGFNRERALAAVWLTGFNFLWFVQSKTAMLDIFAVAFGLWGLLFIFQGKRFWTGWILLGLAMASKWSAVPFLVLALLLVGEPSSLRTLLGLGVALATYLSTFVPLFFLAENSVSPLGLVSHHLLMLRGLGALSDAPHPYASRWWQWITLLRPMWFEFETDLGGERSIWAGGNPVLYWTAFPLLFAIIWKALGKPERQARILCVLYWIPLLFWIMLPRKLQMYYYYLPSSFWVGPIVVWAHEKLLSRVEGFKQTRGWILRGFVLLCGAMFFYFLPIMDGRVLPEGQFRLYMWLRSWF